MKWIVAVACLVPFVIPPRDDAVARFAEVVLLLCPVAFFFISKKPKEDQ